MDYETIEELGEELSPIDHALLFYRLGFPIPVDLATTLIAQGYDLPKLEAQYSI